MRSRYRGFDGEPWPLDVVNLGIVLHQGIAPIEQLEEVRRYLATSRLTHSRVDLILLLPATLSPFEAPRGFRFIGWDIGYYVSEWNAYSFLLHEVIDGRFESLSLFREQLNEYSLVQERRVCAEMLNEKSRLQASGTVFETESESEYFHPIGIAVLSE